MNVKVNPDLKQCATCRYAQEIEAGPGPEDGVSCTSEAMAQYIDCNTNHAYAQMELREYGVIDLFRMEVLGTEEEPVECPCWEPKEQGA